MSDVRTRASLLEALRQAAERPMTAEEIARQRVSFVMGSLGDGSTLTRARVQEILAQQDGIEVPA